MRSAYIHRIVQFALIAVVAAAIYVPFHSNPYVFDDFPAIVSNPFIRVPWPIDMGMSAPYQSPLAGRPIVAYSFTLNFAISKLAPWSYRLTNLGIHLANCLLLMMILNHALRGLAWNRKGWFIAAVVLIWTVHPMLVDAVSYITQRTELMLALFLLLSLWLAIRGWLSSRPYAWLLASVAACAFGMVTKENMVAAPLLILLYHRAFVAKSWSEIFKRYWPFYAALAATWIILAINVSAGHRSLSVGFDLGIRWWEYFRLECKVLIWYLSMAIFPRHFSIHHEIFPPTHWWEYVPQLLVLCTMLATTLWALQRHPKWAFPGVVFFLILGPSSSFVPITTEPMAERRMYLPLLAVLVILGLGVGWLLHRFMSQRIGSGPGVGWKKILHPQRSVVVGTIFVALLAAALSRASVEHLTHWSTTDGPWREVLSVYPESSWAYNNLGAAMVGQNKPDEAMQYFFKVLRIDPGHDKAPSNIASLLIYRGDYELAEAILRGEIDRVNDPAFSLGLLGLAIASQDRIEDAIPYYEKSIQMNPTDLGVQNNLAVALDQVGRGDEAIRILQQAVGYEPSYALSRINLARLLAREEHFDEALSHLYVVLMHHPDSAFAAQMNDVAGAIWMIKDQPDVAYEHYVKAIEDAPDNAVIQARYVRVLLALERYDEAVGHLKAIADLFPPNAEKGHPTVLNAWADYYDATGDPAQAQTYRQMAQAARVRMGESESEGEENGHPQFRLQSPEEQMTAPQSAT